MCFHSGPRAQWGAPSRERRLDPTGSRARSLEEFPPKEERPLVSPLDGEREIREIRCGSAGGQERYFKESQTDVRETKA
jgi:hypothetical protein